MAQLAVTKIIDGPRNAVVHVSISGDGSGDLADEIIIDPAAFQIPLPPVPALKITEVWYDLSGFNAFLEFDYLTSDTPIWTMSGGQGNYVNFDYFGGLSDRSNELDGTGQIKLTTTGLTAGAFGTLILSIKKS